MPTRSWNASFRPGAASAASEECGPPWDTVSWKTVSWKTVTEAPCSPRPTATPTPEDGEKAAKKGLVEAVESQGPSSRRSARADRAGERVGRPRGALRSAGRGVRHSTSGASRLASRLCWPHSMRRGGWNEPPRPEPSGAWVAWVAGGFPRVITSCARRVNRKPANTGRGGLGSARSAATRRVGAVIRGGGFSGESSHSAASAAW
mmetsp:Transcript_43294/g.97838  ORF Transcript_43294/g.97838 Transcript_43294/m.97838 type:complete len:205 (-) Transcript_43294:181-795(-)